MKRQSPCLNCEYREVNCHSKCGSYLNYKELLEKDKERKNDLNAYEYDKKFRMAIRRIRNKRRSF